MYSRLIKLPLDRNESLPYTRPLLTSCAGAFRGVATVTLGAYRASDPHCLRSHHIEAVLNAHVNMTRRAPHLSMERSGKNKCIPGTTN